MFLHLTRSGAAKWNALARRQLHAFVGVVYDNRMISAPIIQPLTTISTFSGFASSSGDIRLGGMTERQAQGLAASL